MRRLILMTLFLLGAITLRAQDLIVKTDASHVEAKVLEITTQEVRYKRFSNLEGPTYILPTKEIAYIDYKNGERETFTAMPTAPVATKADSAVTVVTPPAPPAPTASVAAVLPTVAKAYQVGDYYEKDDLRGVVFAVTDGGLHGLIVSLTESDKYIPWSTLREPAVEVGAKEIADGAKNQETVAAYLATHGLSWAAFPAFAWCHERGEGWYLPAVNELLLLANAFNGGQRMVYDRKARQQFNEALKEHGGKPMNKLVDYYSSTECDATQATSGYMDMEPPYVNKMPKQQKYLVRAVRKF
ncbi:MAG: hypothetical protein RR330_00780 [Alistipes sp.]